MKSKCFVCNSPHVNFYETLFYQSKGKIGWARLEREASKKGENIHRKCFANHFKNHYKPDRVQEMLDKGRVDAQVEVSKQEAINILDEIKANLQGLKNLIAKAKNPSDAVAIYKESRLTLQDIERLRDKLSASTSLTKAELYREIYWACSELCPKCREKFWVKLDERLRSKGFT